MARPLKQHKVESPDEGFYVVSISFDINGSTTPDGLVGDEIVSVARTAAGKFTGTLKTKPAVVLGAIPNLAVSGDSTDIYAQVDTTNTVSAGTFIVRTKTGSTNTDPPDNTPVHVTFLFKKTTRKAR